MSVINCGKNIQKYYERKAENMKPDDEENEDKTKAGENNKLLVVYLQ